ncbi:MAG: hypothetical protein IJ658_04695 [Kiritimatiellae bacterium]|nr:hypothetical protein [Kiritimatiellia bacterium]
MSQTQLELFEEYAKEQPKQDATTTFIIEIEGKCFTCSDQDIDRMEQKFGPHENDDGVSLWWLLRRLKQDGVKRVKLI